MKYIKTYEIIVNKNTVYPSKSLDKYKYKIGDLVHVINYRFAGKRWSESTIFKIGAIDTDAYDCYFLEPIYSYFNEENLIPVPDYELDAMKYNL